MDIDDSTKSKTLRMMGAVMAAIAVSTATTIAVLLMLRGRRVAGTLDSDAERWSGEKREGATASQPIGAPIIGDDVPAHFSEGLLVPGKTFTGSEIVAQDDELGRSPEGV